MFNTRGSSKTSLDDRYSSQYGFDQYDRYISSKWIGETLSIDKITGMMKRHAWIHSPSFVQHKDDANTYGQLLASIYPYITCATKFPAIGSHRLLTDKSVNMSDQTFWQRVTSSDILVITDYFDADDQDMKSLSAALYTRDKKMPCITIVEGPVLYPTTNILYRRYLEKKSRDSAAWPDSFTK